MINENNIPLNLYGTNDVYKCIPDIGEEIKNSVLIALRKEKKEEMVFTESVDRLRKIMMSDEKKLLTGRVIDVNIYCNNPENLEQYHNGQFKMYYNELQRCSKEIVSIITPYITNGYSLSYDLELLFANSERILNQDQYIDKKTFSNIILEVVVLEEKKLMEGDKISNRYGGKGVVSAIIPTEQMPIFGEDQERVDVILNSFGVYNRENPGQILELSINNIGHEIIRYIKKKKVPMEKAFKMILEFVNCIVPEQANAMREMLSYMNEENKAFYLESILRDGDIQISSRPITDSFDIDRLRILYKKFPFVKHMDYQVPMRDSNGNVRFVEARRRVIVGKEYMFRLKQFAEEKFSATSLSSTNISGFNSKSKANKNFLQLYSNTPIRFGNMEINNFNHIGPEAVIENLLIHSMSPHARRSVKSLYTCDPYNIDIKLDDEARNRGAEIINTRLKTIGKRLVFKKIRKKRVKITIDPFFFEKCPVKKPIYFIKDDPNFDPAKYREEQLKKRKNKKKPVINPIKFTATDIERSRQRAKDNEEAIMQMKTNKRVLAERYGEDN